MGFFSSAQNSPKAGSLSRDLLGYFSNEDQNNQRKKELQFKMNTAQSLANQKADKLALLYKQKIRLQTITQKLLAIKDPTKDNIKSWAIDNQISPDEWSKLSPVIKEVQNKPKSAKYVNEVINGKQVQVNSETNRIVTPDLSVPHEHTDETIDGVRGSRDPVTNVWHSYNLPGQGKKSKGSTDTKAFNSLIMSASKSIVAKDSDRPEEQAKNMAAMIPRLSALAKKTADEQGIAPVDAIFPAIEVIKNENIWLGKVGARFPQANRGFNSNRDETVDRIVALSKIAPNSIKSLNTSGGMLSVLGRKLLDLGWSGPEATQILTEAQSLKTYKEAGLDPEKLKSLSVDQGQAIRGPNGDLWARKGNYLINQNNGWRVKYDKFIL